MTADDGTELTADRWRFVVTADIGAVVNAVHWRFVVTADNGTADQLRFAVTADHQRFAGTADNQTAADHRQSVVTAENRTANRWIEMVAGDCTGKAVDELRTADDHQNTSLTSHENNSAMKKMPWKLQMNQDKPTTWV